MMEVEHTSHGPEGKVMKQPTHKKPCGSLQRLTLDNGDGFSICRLRLGGSCNGAGQLGETLLGAAGGAAAADVGDKWRCRRRLCLASGCQTSATLLAYGLAEKHDDEEQQEDEIAPPDDRIAQQVDAVAAAREELTLRRRIGERRISLQASMGYSQLDSPDS